MSVQQILRADIAAFMLLSERLTSLKRNAINQLPLDLTLPTSLSQPLSGTAPKAAPPPKASNPKKRSRSPRRQQPVKGKGGQKGLGPSIPAGLINKALETPQKQRLCWAYNLSSYGHVRTQAGRSCGRPLLSNVCFPPSSANPHKCTIVCTGRP